ncbi:MAG: hypothetical protein M3140_06420 [Actinomycetota bacterium]|nr:hypothetical protein [Actinomycetota bacterium]
MAEGAYGTRYSAAELAQMADEFDRGDYEVNEGHTEVVEADATDTGTAVLSVRLPRSAINALKQAAGDEGVGATVLARRWLLDRLSSETPLTGGTVEVTDLLEWLQTKLTATRTAKATPTKTATKTPTRTPTKTAKATPTKRATATRKASPATRATKAATKTAARIAKPTTRSSDYAPAASAARGGAQHAGGGPG